MASSKVMPSSKSSNSDLTIQSSSSSIHSIAITTDNPLIQQQQQQQQHQQQQAHCSSSSSSFGSMNMDDLLRNIYAADHPPSAVAAATSDVWKEIAAVAAAAGVGGNNGGDAKIGASPTYEEMTLEDFLAKAGAVREEDVRVSPVPTPGGYAAAAVDNSHSHSHSHSMFAATAAVAAVATMPENSIRGKRRAVQEPEDRVAQQRQRRMIKNRESAARSRERKQAYTSELESLVTQLEEENARLIKQQMEQTKKRRKQLMDILIPVEERQRSPRVLRRTRSLNW